MSNRVLQRVVGSILAAIASGEFFWLVDSLCDIWHINRVILIRDGEMETSSVGKYKDYCWIAWYHGSEHVMLRRNGTADDPPFHYRWEPLSHSERDDAASFFDRLGCKEPPK